MVNWYAVYDFINDNKTNKHGKLKSLQYSGFVGLQLRISTALLIICFQTS